MEKNDFLKGYKEVMGSNLSAGNVFVGFCMVVAFLLFIELAEFIEGLIF